MPSLPHELLDHIVDLLQDNQTSLRKCCLVSKSWIHRTRQYLFAVIRFQDVQNLRSWKKTYPDPSASPAHYTRALFIDSPRAVLAAEASKWIASFSSVEHLGFAGTDVDVRGGKLIFAPFRGFSPILKSLRVIILKHFPFQHFFDLVLSFPLLEDLEVINYYNVSLDEGGDAGGLPPIVQPSNLPAFTGTLNLDLRGGIGPIVLPLLAIPGGIHFRKLILSGLGGEDILLTTALVERCSRTLESLDMSLCGAFIRHPLSYGWLTSVSS